MAATKGLGELFVELGLKGLGKTLGGLNAISAQFLLTKNAAEQAIKPIINFSKQAGSQVVGYEKINAVTGLSIKRLAEMDRWAKLNNVDFNAYVGQVQGLQQSILKFRLEGVRNKGFDILGIDPSTFDYRKPEEALRIIANRVTQLDEATGALALSYLGLDANLMYAFNNANTKVNEHLQLSEKELKTLAEQKRAWNELEDAWNQFLLKAMSTKDVIEITKDLTQVVIKLFNWLGKIEGVYSRIKESSKLAFNDLINFKRLMKADVGSQEWKDAWNEYISSPRTPIGAFNSMLNYGANAYTHSLDAYKQGNILPNGTQPVLATTNTSKPADITITQYITGSNAEAISYLVSDRLQQDLNNAKFNNGAVQ